MVVFAMEDELEEGDRREGRRLGGIVRVWSTEGLDEEILKENKSLGSCY